MSVEIPQFDFIPNLGRRRVNTALPKKTSPKSSKSQEISEQPAEKASETGQISKKELCKQQKKKIKTSI